MAAFNGYKSYKDYIFATRRLSTCEQWLYLSLLQECLSREAFPAAEEAIIWSWARTDAEMESVRFILGELFELQDGVYTNAILTAEINRIKLRALKKKPSSAAADDGLW